MNVELEAAEALMDVGVSVPLKAFRIPLTRRWLIFRLTMRRPTLDNLIRIAALYLQMDTSYERMKGFTKEEQMAFIAQHGKRISLIIALTIFRDGISSPFSPLLAWFIRKMVSDHHLKGVFSVFISLMGTQNFIDIIRSVETVNPMKPKLSQKGRKGS